MSVFSALPRIDWVASNDLAFAVRDRAPVSPGHTLVITRRVVADWFAANRAEQQALVDLVGVVKRQLDETFHPDGFSVGFDAGQAAGQTVMHLHVHVIPRYYGDLADRRGGVRHVIPTLADYGRLRQEPLTDGEGTNHLYGALMPLLPRAQAIDILAAFVQGSGLDLLEPPLLAALARGTQLRLLTGDYLDITQERALRRLLEWGAAAAAMVAEDEAQQRIALAVRIVETAHLKRAFHPKSWRIVGDDFGVAWVGSSNLSRSALLQGVEWNLRVDRHLDRPAWDRTVTSFERLWAQGVPLSEAWVQAYALRVRIAARAPHPLPTGEIQAEVPEAPPVPRPLQREALAALARSRCEGRQRALVVMATGLGKTLVAALDIRAFGAEHGRPPRVLVIAHRHELLVQAQHALRRTWPEAHFGWFSGKAANAGAADVLLASVQKLARADHLARFDPKAFDYLLIDEVHHADAPSYRRVLSHFEPSFVLGLTATPERADSGDVIGLFDDHIAYRADLGVGITEKLLVPFRYFGLADPTDYTPIPWRNGRFDAAALAAAVQTQVRMERLWDAWTEPDKTKARTLVFCASTAHADFVSSWLSTRGVRSVAVHSAGSSADRVSALADLEDGRLDAICSIDLFNEGVDCPRIDRVVMLRPTESPVVFLQQLGRGLRTAAGKRDLVVIDFVGNHRVFLDRVRTLLSVAAAPLALAEFLANRSSAQFLGECDIHLDLVAIDLLTHLMPQRGTNAAERAYRELRSARGERPARGELVRMGLNVRTLQERWGGWFAFVSAEGDLDADETAVWAHSQAWLQAVETTPRTNCFTMVVLEVLLEAEALFTGMDLAVLAERCHAYLVRSPELMRDLEGVAALPVPQSPSPEAWRRYWESDTGPIAAWTARGKRQPRTAWFGSDGNRLVPHIPVPQNAEHLAARMTRELVDAWLAEYRRRRAVVGADGVVVKVIRNQRDPILKLPDGPRRERLPQGEVTVRLPDGASWQFRFAKIACNVAHRPDSHVNALPDLLRRWFGPGAGLPGTDGRVRFYASPDGLCIEPLDAQEEPLRRRARVVALPVLSAAARHLDSGGDQDRFEAREVSLPLPARATESLVAVRAAGDSAAGIHGRIHEGDWMLMGSSSPPGRTGSSGPSALPAAADSAGDPAYLRQAVDKDRIEGRVSADKPDYRTQPVPTPVPGTVLVGVVRPEDLAPAVGAMVTAAHVPRAFGLSDTPHGEWSRIDGHLFVTIDLPTWSTAPGRAAVPVPDRWPAETAFVLVGRSGGDWFYAGVGRWRDEEGAWVVAAPPSQARQQWAEGTDPGI